MKEKPYGPVIAIRIKILALDEGYLIETQRQRYEDFAEKKVVSQATKIARRQLDEVWSYVNWQWGMIGKDVPAELLWDNT